MVYIGRRGFSGPDEDTCCGSIARCRSRARRLMKSVAAASTGSAIPIGGLPAQGGRRDALQWGRDAMR